MGMPAAFASRASGLRFPVDLPTDGALYRLKPAFPRLAWPGRPLFATMAPGTKRLYVVDQGGRIDSIPNRETVGPADRRPFLDLGIRVRSDAYETGLLGLAFDPDFARNREFYVAYTDPSLALVVARGRARDAMSAENAAPEIVIRVPKREPHDNHNGGMIAFGPDGFLYVGTGDGGYYGDPLGNSQNMGQLLGKLLRLDVRGQTTYRVPEGNPFVSVNGARPEIWALGLRNPWRFSFDRASGELWLGDVGQDAREEINLIEAGGNYGWNVREGRVRHERGPAPVPGRRYLEPLYDYPHWENGQRVGGSVTGGYVYRGRRDAALRGTYVFADFVSRKIWGLRRAGGSQVTRLELASQEGVVSFGEDDEGELFVVSRSAGGGAISRFEAVLNSPALRIPSRLSQTGLFASTRELVPAAGVHPYEVNSELWSDGARKRRWVAVPSAGFVEFRREGAWEFPVGSVFVKHFELPTVGGRLVRLETRVLVRHRAPGGPEWRGYTYRWNSNQDDAVLIDGAEQASYEVENADGSRRRQTWSFPSRADCLQCHVGGAGGTLGGRTAQLHRPVRLADARLVDQIRHWESLGLLRGVEGTPAEWPAYAALADESADLERRVRSYLAVNCSHCHFAGGPAPGGLDLRAEIPLSRAAIVGTCASEGDLGLNRPYRVHPGRREASVLWARLKSLDADVRMPPLATSVEHAEAVRLVGSWIDGLPGGALAPCR